MPDDRSLVGLAGLVVLPLRPGSGRVVVRRGGREHELMARPFEDAPDAETWTSVVVVDVVDGTALVSPYAPSELRGDRRPFRSMQLARQQRSMLVEEAVESGRKAVVVRRHERKRKAHEAAPGEVVSGAQHLEVEKPPHLARRLLSVDRPSN